MHAVEQQIRGLVVGHFQRNKNLDRMSALQAANVKLNAKGLSKLTLGDSGASCSTTGLAAIKNGQKDKY